MTAEGIIVSATEVRAQVKDTLDINIGNIRYRDRTYPDICSLPELRSVLLTSRIGNQGGSRPK